MRLLECAILFGILATDPCCAKRRGKKADSKNAKDADAEIEKLNAQLREMYHKLSASEARVSDIGGRNATGRTASPWPPYAGLLGEPADDLPADVVAREQQIGGSGGSLEPPGPPS